MGVGKQHQYEIYYLARYGVLPGLNLGHHRGAQDPAP